MVAWVVYTITLRMEMILKHAIFLPNFSVLLEISNQIKSNLSLFTAFGGGSLFRSRKMFISLLLHNNIYKMLIQGFHVE